jgi:hypothetical protein
MLVVSTAKIIASAVVLTLASQCARNMIQTARIVAGTEKPSPAENVLPSAIVDTSILDARNLYDTDTLLSSLPLPPVVKHLQSLDRKELLELFCQSQPPKENVIMELNGEWNGCLLENNGRIMTSVSNIMTHLLFGKGHRWNGKVFSPSSRGWNRFVAPKNRFSEKNGERQVDCGRRSFQYSLQESRIQPGTKSVQLEYSKYHSPFSLWHTMMDEVRLVPGVPDVLIGMGCMGWSGGMLNAAPFCLWRSTTSY